MKIRVTYIATINDKDLTDEGIDLNDLEAVKEYFYEMGAYLIEDETIERID